MKARRLLDGPLCGEARPRPIDGLRLFGGELCCIDSFDDGADHRLAQQQVEGLGVFVHDFTQVVDVELFEDRLVEQAALCGGGTHVGTVPVAGQGDGLLKVGLYQIKFG
ncbi:MAG: hypothetical protein V9E89_10910 [Ilumatobacteraceae bacterium]